ncbi:MAG: hypothetical protein H6R25_3706 [Proteobacteria bacterium]|nr:hypothetical protein [Pseudomonadota bacterium]
MHTLLKKHLNKEVGLKISSGRIAPARLVMVDKVIICLECNDSVYHIPFNSIVYCIEGKDVPKSFFKIRQYSLTIVISPMINGFAAS